jgi:hypothetical protein
MSESKNKRLSATETATDMTPNGALFPRKLSYKRIGLASMSLTVLVAAGVGNHVYSDQISDILHDASRSSKESTIKAAVEHATGNSIIIRCVDQTFLQDVTGRPKNRPSRIGGITQYIGNVPSSIDVDSEFCANIVAYTETSALRNNPTPQVARAIGVLAHEYSHHSLGVIDESEAGCFSVQVSSELAQGMGATPDEAVLLRERLNTLFTPLVPSDVNRYMAPYGITSDCVASGAYDLNLPGNAFPPVGTALS